MIDRNDPRPAWQQLADSLRAQIQAGDYQPGERIPSGRDLARRYSVALNTVQHAVESLRAAGVLVSHPPRGVFVAGAGEPDALEELRAEVAALRRDVDELRRKR